VRPDSLRRVSPQPRPGSFLSFEGGEGVGKSTQARLLGGWLHDAFGCEVVLTREPGGTALGVELRNAVLHGEDVDARTEALLYATDRAHHVHSLIRPALARGAVVISDRYLDSSVAYQGDGRDLGVDEIVSPTRMILGSIEADIPVHELLHLAVLGGGELELVEAQLREDSPAIGRLAGTLELPDGCSLFAIIRDDRALSVRSDTELQKGDKVIGIGRTECEGELHRILLGDPDRSN